MSMSQHASSAQQHKHAPAYKRSRRSQYRLIRTIEGTRTHQASTASCSRSRPAVLLRLLDVDLYHLRVSFIRMHGRQASEDALAAEAFAEGTAVDRSRRTPAAELGEGSTGCDNITVSAAGLPEHRERWYSLHPEEVHRIPLLRTEAAAARVPTHARHPAAVHPAVRRTPGAGRTPARAGEVSGYLRMVCARASSGREARTFAAIERLGRMCVRR